jgi:hypothetical protein
MIPWLCTIPMLLLQPATAMLPVADAKDLPAAARGPMVPQGPDRGGDGGMISAMRRQARKGPGIPALQLPAGSLRVKDKVPDISGWRAYAIEVPAGESVRVQVVEGRKGWFRVLGVNAWGDLEEGLLQNRIPSGEPQASYKNPRQETRTIYFIVDTLDANMMGEDFEVEVIRN